MRYIKKVQSFQKSNYKTIAIFLLALLQFSSIIPLIIQPDDNISSESLNLEKISARENPSILTQYQKGILLDEFDNKSKDYLYFTDNISAITPASILNAFISLNGSVLNGPWQWDSYWGFKGRINNSAENLGEFNLLYPELQTFEDQVIEIQSAYAKAQMGFGNLGFDYTDVDYQPSNASIAFFDTGVDLTHSFLNTSNITFWEDFVDFNHTPVDLHGHGTALIGTVVGNDTKFENETIPSDLTYNISIREEYEHYRQFYPEHINPGNYEIQLASFYHNITQNPILNISYEIITFHEDYLLEIKKNDNTVNESQIEDNEGNFSVNLTEDDNQSFEKIDIVLTYNKSLTENPSFDVAMNLSISPISTNLNQSYSGILPQSPYGVLKIANASGSGYLSTLFDALKWISTRHQVYDITTAIIPFAMYYSPDFLEMAITSYINNISISTNIQFFISAGNQGIDGDLNQLTGANSALVVGAINSMDYLTAYSGLGGIIEDLEVTQSPNLDILAPGGSYLSEGISILSPLSNKGQFSTKSIQSSFLTPSVGTSISAAIAAANYHILLNNLANITSNAELSEDIIDNIKNLYRLSSTELNTEREENPYTSIIEEDYSPEVNRGGWDRYEGFGRINPLSILNISQISIINSTDVFVNLSASNFEPNALHIAIYNVSLQKNQMYRFQMLINETVEGPLDVDLYVYKNTPNAYGDPTIVASGINGFGQSENVYYTNLNETTHFYVVLKAISGSGRIQLNLSAETIPTPPELSDAEIQVFPSGEFNDTLDEYVFQINYTQAENYPASQVTVHFEDSSMEFTLDKNFFDNTFDDGCLYQGNVKFEFPGNYSFYYSVQVGPYSLNYSDPDFNHIVINPIGNQVSLNYYTNFSKNLGLWNGTSELIMYELWDQNISAYAGWNYVQVPTEWDPRDHISNQNNWTAMYCGLTKNSTSSQYKTVYNATNSAVYNNLGMADEYELLSPYLFLSDTYTNPEIRLGLRVDLLESDSFSIQIRTNRETSWTNLEQFQGVSMNWFEINFNLTEYKNNFIQFRFLSDFSATLDQSSSGVMIDYVLMNKSALFGNSYEPMLSPIYDSLLKTNLSLVTPLNSDKFQAYQFQIAYVDEDRQLPSEIWLELRNDNQIMKYEMINRYGMWYDNQGNEKFPNSIIFTYTTSLYEWENAEFRFTTSDGKFSYETQWYPQINFTLPDVPTNPVYDFTEISYLKYQNNEYIAEGNPWINKQDGWHTLNYLGFSEDPQEWYCGEDYYAGYSPNQDSLLIFSPIQLNDSKDLFLTFSHRLRFDTNGPTEEEYGRILISITNGNNWEELQVYDAATDGIGFSSQAIALEQYNYNEILLAFEFLSDSEGEKVKNSGWRITNLTIDFNRSVDYSPPNIEFVNIEPGQILQGAFNFSFIISDESQIDHDLVQIWFNEQEIIPERNNNTYYYWWNTDDFDNGEMEITILVYDVIGNKNNIRISVYIENPNNPWNFVLYGGLILGTLALFGYLLYRKQKRNHLINEGKLVPTPSKLELFQIARRQRHKIKEELQLIAENTDPQWEKAQNFQLHCSNCKVDFRSPKYEIFCPECQKDQLKIAKFCPVCEKWNYYEEEAHIHKCRKCHIPLLKDFQNAKEYIIERGIDLGKYSGMKKDLDDLYRAVENIPTEELKKILPKLLPDLIPNNATEDLKE